MCVGERGVTDPWCRTADNTSGEASVGRGMWDEPGVRNDNIKW